MRQMGSIVLLIISLFFVIQCDTAPVEVEEPTQPSKDIVQISNRYVWERHDGERRRYEFFVFLDDEFLFKRTPNDVRTYSNVSKGDHCISCLAVDTLFDPPMELEKTACYSFYGVGAKLNLEITATPGMMFPQITRE